MGGAIRVQKNLKIDTRNNVTAELARWTGDVSHNADGSLSLSAEGSFTMNSPLTGGNVSASLSCTVIPRASTFKTGTSSIEPGASVNIKLSPADDSFSHKISLSLGKKSLVKSLSKGVKSTDITVPTSWAEEITTSKSGNILIKLQTYKDASEIGSKSGTLTLEIPETDEYLPSFSLQMLPISESVPEEWGVYVRGKSSVKVSVCDASYKHSAVFSSVSVKVGEIVKNTAPVEMPLTSAGEVQISVTLCDSRGFKRTVTSTVEVIDYYAPCVNINKLFRCDEDGTENASGTYLAAEFTNRFSSIGGKNSSAVTLRYRKTGETSYISFENVTSVFVFGEGTISPSASYEVEFLTEDSLTEAPRSFVRRISSADIPFNIKSGGKGAAFGCYAENDNELTVAYDLKVCGKIKSEDVVSEIVLSDNVELVKGKVLYYKALGAVFFNVRFVIKNNIAANTEAALGKLSAATPFCLNPLSVRITTTTAACTAYVTYDSNICIRCAEAINANSWAYVSGVVLNFK